MFVPPQPVFGRVRKSNLGTGTGQPFGITEQLEAKAKKGNTTAHT
jgi:hypothetical protein